MIRRTTDEFRDKLRDLLPELRRRFGVETLALFGSYVQGTAGPDSDLDVLVTFRVTPGMLRFLELENFLSDRLGVTVDLVLERALRPSFRERVLSEAEAV